jgi:uncharacterized damage-inducible protein DinB
VYIRGAAASHTDELLWHRPAAPPSAGFHVLHAMGSLDRLMTYVRDEALSSEQWKAYERESSSDPGLTVQELVALAEETIDRAVEGLRSITEDRLLDPRTVGRARYPSNVLGLLFHAAEHTARHTGQLVTTAKFLATTADANS